MRISRLVLAAGALTAFLPACGTSSSANTGDAGQPACLAALDAGFVNGPESLSEDGGCGNLLTGTKGNGEPCQNDSECAPTCCACPGGRANADVAWCNAGTCVVGSQACCAFVASAMLESEAGIPFACQAH